MNLKHLKQKKIERLEEFFCTCPYLGAYRDPVAKWLRNELVDWVLDLIQESEQKVLEEIPLSNVILDVNHIKQMYSQYGLVFKPELGLLIDSDTEVSYLVIPESYLVEINAVLNQLTLYPIDSNLRVVSLPIVSEHIDGIITSSVRSQKFYFSDFMALQKYYNSLYIDQLLAIESRYVIDSRHISTIINSLFLSNQDKEFILHSGYKNRIELFRNKYVDEITNLQEKLANVIKENEELKKSL